MSAIGGQSAPPSLKVAGSVAVLVDGRSYRGAVRPPFIEGECLRLVFRLRLFYRGAVRPPFIEGPAVAKLARQWGLSGGSPPPLH